MALLRSCLSACLSFILDRSIEKLLDTVIYKRKHGKRWKSKESDEREGKIDMISVVHHDPSMVLGRVGCHLVDAAEALRLAGAPLHADVALLAPVGAPRVLDDDVVLPLAAAVAHRRHAVVQLRPARSIEDALHASCNQRSSMAQSSCKCNQSLSYVPRCRTGSAFRTPRWRR